MNAGALAKTVRLNSGISQTELAIRSGVASSSLSLIEHGKREPTTATLTTLLNSLRHSLVTIPTVRSDAAQIAHQIGVALQNSDNDTAFRRFIQLADNLESEIGATKVGLTLTEPAPTGSEYWDLAIAALCEYRLNAKRLPVPEWVHKNKGHKGSKWSPVTSEYDIPVNEGKVPRQFSNRGIFIEAATLESA